MPGEPQRGERIEFVQALRGIAAMAVVMFHGRIWISGPTFLDAGNRIFLNGAGGVELFFVISGFIMVHAAWHRPGGVRGAVQFFARRLIRIWPVYVIATFALLVAEGTLHEFLATRSGLLHLAKAFVFYPGKHGPPFFGWAPNGVGWTLNYEMWFYFLFALALLGGRRWRWSLLVGWFGLFLVVVPLIYTGHTSWDAYFSYDMKPAILNLAANSFIWEFLGGVAIGMIYHSKIRIRNRELLGTFAILAVTAVVWQQLSDEWKHHGMIGWGPGMIVMVLALALWDKAYPIKVPRPLLWLGDVSFSLYLVHRIPQLGVPRMIPIEHASLGYGAGLLIATTVLALVLAHFSYRYLEQGLSTRIRIWLLGS